MHDPQVVAFEIRRPWPERSALAGRRFWPPQVHLAQRLHRFLFERCEECGHRFPWGYAPVSHQWDQPRGPRFKVVRRAFHHECSSLVHHRRTAEQDAERRRG